jgi:hypothetical protein
MGTSIITPNMNLIEPTVGQEFGPQYALDINNSLTLIDQHDHSPGKGVQITPAGININASLSFNNNPALMLSYLSLEAGSSASTTLQSISSAPASNINELFYTDSNGTTTQITKNGQVNVIASSIPGESYDAGTFVWTQTQSSLPTTPANFDIGSITLRPNTALTTNGVELIPPSSVSTSFTFPSFSASIGGSLPAVSSFLQMSAGGVISTSVAVANGITASNIANNTITTNQISTTAGILPSQLDSVTSGNYVALSSSSGSFFTAASSNSPTHYQFIIPASSVTSGATYTNNGHTYTVTATISSGTLLSATSTGAPTFSGTLTKTGGTGPTTIAFTQSALGAYVTNLISIAPSVIVTTRPLFINFIGNMVGSTTTLDGGWIGIGVDANTVAKCVYQISRSDGAIISSFAIYSDEFQGANSGTELGMPCGMLNCIDTAPISGGSYSLSTIVVNIAGSAADSFVTNVSMQVLQV